MPRNLITGITGQDGIHMSKLLAARNEPIIGVVTKKSDLERITLLKKISTKIQFIEVEDFQPKTLQTVLRNVKPERIYNFAAISSVKKSFDDPELTFEVNYNLFNSLLLAVSEELSQQTKVFQCSSSEMFGNSIEEFQNEDTAFAPVSPYGESKTKAHLLARDYRNNGLFVTSGILFNHESEFRKPGFLIEKIVSFMSRRNSGIKEVLELGTLDISRDWGYAGDFVEGMTKALDSQKADEFIFATGIQRTILELIETCLEIIGDSTPISEVVRVNHSLARSAEKFTSRGDYSKAKEVLHWQPETPFHEMLTILIKAKLPALT
jgi:GDPmannose 4,6-dehydratase